MNHFIYSRILYNLLLTLAQDLNIGAPVYGYIALFKTQKWLFAKKVCMINCTTGVFDSLITILISSSLMGHVKGLGRH